ncbi:MAG: TlpA family protein disulfide reductase, partial [Streptosporangiaceae bacterium]
MDDARHVHETSAGNVDEADAGNVDEADAGNVDEADAGNVDEAGPAPRTWAGAMGSVWATVKRHRIASGVIALCVAGSLAAFAWAGTGAPAAPATRPTDTVAPTFSLPVLGHSGQRISLSHYSGRPLIVNFFASWCAPCQRETPLLAKFYRTEHGKVALVGLDENDVMASALSFTRAKGVSYPVGWDPQLSAASAYGVSALPQTFFLNAQH